MSFSEAAEVSCSGSADHKTDPFEMGGLFSCSVCTIHVWSGWCPRDLKGKENACTVETNPQNTEQNMKLKSCLQLQRHSIIIQVPNSFLKTEEALNEMYSLN